MVKAAKKKGKYVEIAKVRNVETKFNTQTLQKYSNFLKENNMIRVRNLNDLKKRCNLFIQLCKKAYNMF